MHLIMDVNLSLERLTSIPSTDLDRFLKLKVKVEAFLGDKRKRFMRQRKEFYGKKERLWDTYLNYTIKTCRNE